MKKNSKTYTMILAVTFLFTSGMASYSIVQAASHYHNVPVYADYETDAVEVKGDAADDPAIWVHPDDPSKSIIIATNKKGGLLTYSLKGKELSSVKVGKPNNVDVRYGFTLDGEKIDFCAATDRDNNGIILYKIDQETGNLSNIAVREIKAKMKTVYGFSLYHNLNTGKFYALVVGHNGEFEQYELFDNGNGKIDGKLVRSFEIGSISEGLVADDEYGCFYVSEENAGIWKYSADPSAGTKRILVDSVGDGKLIPDVEGLTIYYAKNGKGYLIASNQGDNSYNVYQRDENNKFIGTFSLEDGVIDGTNDTDGIDVIAFHLGEDFPYGMFIAQDGENMDGKVKKSQNFKIVRWENIANALKLNLDNSVNPRKLKAINE